MKLSTAELSQLRADGVDYLPDTCTLQTLTRTADDMGGWTEGWSNQYTSVACRIWQKAGRELMVGGQITEVTHWTINVAHDQALDATMRVAHDSKTYQVNDVQDTGTERVYRRAWMTRLD